MCLNCFETVTNTTNRGRRCRIVLECTFLFLLFVLVNRSYELSAQTGSPLSSWQYSAGEVMAKYGGPLPDWRVMLGAVGSIAPTFEGSDKYKITPGGFLDVRFRDLAFLSTGEGVGVNLLRGMNYRAGISLGYDTGRKDDNDHGIKGLPKVSPAPEIKAFGEIFIMPVALTFNFRRAVGGHNGWIGDIGFYMPLFEGGGFILFAGPSVTFVNSEYMNAYFDVSQEDSAKSELPPYDANACCKNANFGITTLYYITEKLFIISEISYERLLSDAEESPVSRKDNLFAADFGLVYSF